MTARRRVIEIAMTEDEQALLAAIEQSRTGPAGRVERAADAAGWRVSCRSVGAAIGVSHHTVLRCLDGVVRLGVIRNHARKRGTRRAAASDQGNDVLF